MANLKQENVKRFIEDISKEVAKNAYEGGGQGGGTGSNYLMTTMDYFQVVGKHIDVDALISLFEKHNVDMDTEIDPQDQDMIGIILDYQIHSSIFFGYNVCRGGVEINIFNTPLENLEVAYTYRTILTANKEKIESFEITDEVIWNLVSEYEITSNLVMNKIGNYAGGNNYITIQEALSIFK